MKNKNIPVKCLNCGKVLDNVEAFAEHNKKCGSHGYSVLVGAVANIQPKKMNGTPKDVSNEALKSETTKTEKRVLDTSVESKPKAKAKKSK